MHFNLTPRLALVHELCKGYSSFFDIGCDHAHLAIALAQSGAKRVIASDIRIGPINSAKRNIAAAGLEKVISTHLTAGLSGFCPQDGQVIIICGMGGDTISQILADADWALEGEHLLILQPMTASVRLRAFLHERNCIILNERIAQEGKRFYPIIVAKGGGKPEAEHNRFLFSEKAKQDVLFKNYLKYLHAKHLKILNGKIKGQQPCEDTRLDLKIIEQYL